MLRNKALRYLAWTVATIAAALGLLWGAHEYVPGVSGLGDLNNLAGIGAFALAAVSLVLFFVSRETGATAQAAGDNPGTAQQATTDSGPVAQNAGDRSSITQVSGDSPTIHQNYGTPPAGGAPGEESAPPGWLDMAVSAGETDPDRLGAHAARPGTDSHRQPPYVAREADADLDAHLDAAAQHPRGGLVLVAGAPTAGKTRALAAALARTLPERTLLAPPEETDLRPLPRWLAQRTEHAPHGWVIWLDDLDRHLPHAHLEPALLDELGAAGAIVVATIRLTQLNALKPAATDTGDRTVGYRVLNTPTVDLKRRWSSQERQSAADTGDARLTEAADQVAFGVAEYLAAGPELERDWKHGPDTGNPRGFALVAAAVDLARTGLSAPLTRAQIEQVAGHYLPTPPPAPEDAEVAWEWATDMRSGVAGLLVPADADQRSWRAFDYLTTEEPVPETTWQTALEWADDEDHFAIGVTAYTNGDHAVAETAWLQVAEAGNTGAMVGLGALRKENGRVKEAEGWWRRAREAGEG